jgi:hypothetical protein
MIEGENQDQREGQDQGSWVIEGENLGLGLW